LKHHDGALGLDEAEYLVQWARTARLSERRITDAFLADGALVVLRPTEIELNGSGWQTPLDFYDALLAALSAPHWHGRSLDALLDSMIGGGINAVEAPYTVTIESAEEPSTRAAIQELAEALRDPSSLTPIRIELR
jgi:RNAse (barnase) inhibitor barstar